MVLTVLLQIEEGILESFFIKQQRNVRDILAVYMQQLRCCMLYFCHWDISVISPMIVLKLAVTVFISLCFRTLWPNWLNLFKS